MTRFNILRTFLVVIVGLPVALWVYLADHDIPPTWFNVTCVLGYPILFLVFLCVGAWAIPQQKPSVGIWFLFRRYYSWW